MMNSREIIISPNMQVPSAPCTEFTQNCMNIPYLRVRAIKYLNQHFFYLSSYILVIEAARHLKRYFKRLYSLSINKPMNTSLKSTLLAKKTCQFFCKSIGYLFFSWSTDDKPPYKIFKNLKDLFMYCPDSIAKLNEFNKTKKLKIIKEISAYKKLRNLVIKSSNLELFRPLLRLNLARFDFKCSFSDVITSCDLMSKFSHPNTELNISFNCNEALNREIHGGLIMKSFKITNSITINVQQDINDLLVFKVLSLNSFQMNSLKKFSFNFTIRQNSDFPDFNFLEKLSTLEELCFRIELNGKCDHEIFDMIKFPNTIKSLSLLFLKSNMLDLRDSNLSKSFFYSILKLTLLDNLEISFSENVPGIIRTKDIMTKHFFTYFIKRIWIFLPRKLSRLRLESPFLTESDDFFWRNLGVHKNIESLEMNLNGQYPKYSSLYTGKIVLEKLKNLKVCETLFLLTFLSPSSFQRIETCTIIVMDKDAYLDFRGIIDIVLMMKSLVNLEIFYFVTQPFGNVEAEVIRKMIRVLKELRDVKITTMNQLNDEGINLIKNELERARKIHNATISFKSLTLKKYFSHTFVIQF